jgi:putative chitinase
VRGVLVTRPAPVWFNILQAAGVRADRAALHAPAFANVLQGTVLSRGEDELDDFLGQILHESGMLKALRENLNYSADGIRRVAAGFKPGTRWHEAGLKADWMVAGGPERIGNFLYCDRMGNGSFESGDGYDFRGGAHLMVTGREAFERCGLLVGQDLTVNPTLVEMPHFALQISVACWEGLVPDSCINDCVKVTKKVNGGTIGIQHRLEVTVAAGKALQEFA